jgi:hypothetical protein
MQYVAAQHPGEAHVGRVPSPPGHDVVSFQTTWRSGDRRGNRAARRGVRDDSGQRRVADESCVRNRATVGRDHGSVAERERRSGHAKLRRCALAQQRRSVRRRPPQRVPVRRGG